MIRFVRGNFDFDLRNAESEEVADICVVISGICRHLKITMGSSREAGDQSTNLGAINVCVSAGTSTE